jgi:hypothetical protein
MDWDGPGPDPADDEREPSPPPPREEATAEPATRAEDPALEAPDAPDVEFEQYYAQYYKEYLQQYMRAYDVKEPGQVPRDLVERAQWWTQDEQKTEPPPKVQWMVKSPSTKAKNEAERREHGGGECSGSRTGDVVNRGSGVKRAPAAGAALVSYTNDDDQELEDGELAG